MGETPPFLLMPLSPSSFFIPPAGVPFVLEDKYLRGGYRVVATNAERDAIAISARKQGMRVLVADANFIEYELRGGTGNGNWQIATFKSKEHTHVSSDITDLSTTISNTVTAMRGGQTGLAYLLDGKLDPMLLPSVAIGDTFVALSESEMLSLPNAGIGDVVVRTDLSSSFILASEPASVLANWQELLSPTSQIVSINGQTSGTIVLDANAVGAAPVSHTHLPEEIIGLPNLFEGKADLEHTHPSSAISDLDTVLSGKSDLDHSHTIAQVADLQSSLDSKAPAAHAHTFSDVGGLNAALDGKVSTADFLQGLDTKAAVVHDHTVDAVTGLQSALDGKAPTVHAHAVSDVTGLQNELDGKAPLSHNHQINNIDGLQTELDGKAPTLHSHAVSDVTGLQAALDGKAPTGHSHFIANVTGLQTALDGKAPTSHNHTIANVTGLQTAIDTKFDKTGGTVNGNLTVTGDLIIQGSATTINTTELEVSDPIITVAKNNSAGTLPYAGIKVERGAADAFLVFNEATDRFTAYTSSDDLATAGVLAPIEASVFHGALSGNATSATSAARLTTGRTISFTGDVTGVSSAFDGSGNISVALTVQDDSHSHTIANVDGLQTALDGKASTAHTHADATTTVSGHMSAADKTKLNGIATSANNYVHPTGDGNLHVPATGTTNNTRVLKAGATAGSLSWGQVAYSELSGAPSTMPPDAHTHAIADVTGLQAALNGKLATTGIAANSSLLQGFASNAGAVANTIALRDAAGKITAVDFTMTSDIRHKEVLGNLDDNLALDQVLRWESIFYRIHGQDRVMPGHSAQQIMTVTPHLVDASDDDHLKVSYALSSAYYAAAFRAVLRRLEKLENYAAGR